MTTLRKLELAIWKLLRRHHLASVEVRVNVRHTPAPIGARQAHERPGDSDVRQRGGYVLHTYPLPPSDARSHTASLGPIRQAHIGA